MGAGHVTSLYRFKMTIKLRTSLNSDYKQNLYVSNASPFQITTCYYLLTSPAVPSHSPAVPGRQLSLGGVKRLNGAACEAVRVVRSPCVPGRRARLPATLGAAGRHRARGLQVVVQVAEALV